MEVKIKQTEFLSLLRWAQGVVDRKSTMPILSNLLLEGEGGRLKVSATDLEIGLVVQGEAEVIKGGKVVVNARSLFEIVKEAPDASIRIRSEGASLEITSGKARFKVVGLDPAEFPALPSGAGKGEVRLDASLLEGMISKTFYAISNDETRYTLNGLYFVEVPQTDKTYFRVVGTDGHRLSYVEREVSKKLKLDKGIIIPKKGIAELRKLLAEGTGELAVSLDEKAICFRRESVSLMVRLIAGDYPAYEQVVPKKVDKVVSVDRGPFTGALRRASILAADQGRGVTMALSSGTLEVSASNPDLGEAREELTCQYKGGNLKIGFNPRYLLDILDVLEDEKVVLEVKDEVSPCVIRSEFDRGFLALVMPMRI